MTTALIVDEAQNLEWESALRRSACWGNLEKPAVARCADSIGGDSRSWTGETGRSRLPFRGLKQRNSHCAAPCIRFQEKRDHRYNHMRPGQARKNGKGRPDGFLDGTAFRDTLPPQGIPRVINAFADNRLLTAHAISYSGRDEGSPTLEFLDEEVRRRS